MGYKNRILGLEDWGRTERKKRVKLIHIYGNEKSKRSKQSYRKQFSNQGLGLSYERERGGVDLTSFLLNLIFVL